MRYRKYGPAEWRAIQQYIDEGHGFIACHARFGIAHATWKSAILRGDLRAEVRLPGQGDGRRRYDWSVIQAYYDTGKSFLDTRRHFGFTNAAWYKAVQRGDVRPRDSYAMPIEQLLTGRRQRAHVKARLLHAGILKNECAECGLQSWRDRPISMHLDHINGVKDDHRLENLRMLCPNCHSQTDTYGGRNLKRRRRLQDSRSAV